MDTITSLLAAVTIFAIIGNLAEELDVNIHDVFRAGPAITFTTYPHAIAKLQFVPQLFSALFFLMILTLGLGSATALCGCVVSFLADQFPEWNRWVVTLLFCLTGYSIGLIYITPGGSFIRDLVDHFGAGFVIYIATVIELLAVCWIYGIGNFCADVEFMLGTKHGLYWKLCWCFNIPLGLIIIIAHIFTMEGQFNLNSHGVSTPAIACGWILSTMSLLLLPIFAVREVYYTEATTIIDKLKKSLRPDISWGPKAPAVRKRWMEHKNNRSAF